MSLFHTIPGKEKNLGDFTVRRVLPEKDHRMVGPWIFFDHLGPATFAPGTGIDVRPHPHIGLATVTYLLDGALVHRDSLGYTQTIRPGAVNWMTAGNGIVHSERSPVEVRGKEHSIHALQLWIALPEDAELTNPAFFHHPAHTIPVVEGDGFTANILVGTAFGKTSPVATHSPAIFVDVVLTAGGEVTLPSCSSMAVYVLSGEVTLEGKSVEPLTMAIVCPEQGNLTLQASSDSQVIIIGGESLSERHIWWNFVASDKALLEEAKRRWRAGGFPKVPGESSFIPLP